MHADEVHVWYGAPSSIRSPEALAACHAVLSPDERTRHAAFLREGDGRAFLAARSMLRFALSGLVPGVPPHAWVFVRGPHGRPEIGAPATGLRFNVSHTAGLVALVVARELDCGIDVERTRRATDTASLAGRALAPREAARLAAAPRERHGELFLRHWTLKEAYTKALGAGTLIPFGRIGFETGARGPRLDPAMHTDGADWQFAQWSPVAGPAGEAFLLSLALRRRDRRELRIVRHSGWPTCPAPTGGERYGDASPGAVPQG